LVHFILLHHHHLHSNKVSASAHEHFSPNGYPQISAKNKKDYEITISKEKITVTNIRSWHPFYENTRRNRRRIA
jgi:hypothetical protein